MQLSKLTFSLASLVVLVAFGLVFVTTPVMAHETADYDENHDGRLNSDTDVADPTELNHTHLAAPTVTSIELVDIMAGASTVKDSSVQLVADVTASPAVLTDLTGSVDGRFQVKVTFSGPVYNAAAAGTGALNADLAVTDLTLTAASQASPSLNLEGATGVSISAVARMADDAMTMDVDESLNTFLVTVTVDADLFGDATADPVEPSDLPVDVWLTVDENVLYIRDGGLVNGVAKFGRGNASPSPEMFTVVAILPDALDTGAPTVTITTKDKKLNVAGYLVFTIKFSEAVTGFSLSDVKVKGGTKEDFVTGEDNSYFVTVKPTSADTKVTVSIAADAVMDSAENGNTAGEGSYIPDGYVATVDITAADGTGDDEDKVIFTLNFSEEPDAFSVASLSVTGAAAPGVTDLVELVGDEADEDSAATYTLTVTPTAGATEVKVSIAAGVLSATDAADKTNFFASSAGMHTVTPSTTGTGGLATGDTRDNVTEPTEFTLAGMLAPDSFVVVAPMDRTDIDGTEIMIAELPNIQRFFAKGGTISIVGGSGAAGDAPNKSVVITEIMWGLNHAQAIGDQANYQWIELYNTDNVNSDANTATGAPATVDLSTYKLVFTPETDLPKPAKLADQVSNIELGGWDVDVGQSGSLGAATDTFSPTRMISMYRNITYDNVTKIQNEDDAADNRKKQLAAIPSGNVEGSWEASKVSDTYAANQQGSPGAEQFVGRAGFNVTNVGRNAVVITEVGNNSNDAYDWVELVAIADTNLENYELQYIEGQNITVLSQFVKKVLKAGEILVVLQSDPRDNPEHPVAAGKVWEVGRCRS